MAVAHIILHSFGSWHPDHAAGWHRHGVGRPLAKNATLGNYRRRIQKQPTVYFSEDEQYHLLERLLDVSQRRQWRCHAISTQQTHVHAVISWKAAVSAQTVQNTCKRLLGLRVAELRGKSGLTWFSRGGKPEPVANREHLEFLLNDYLTRQVVWYWCEGAGTPQKLH